VGGLMLVLGIETSTPQTSVALGTEQGIVASTVLTRGRPGHEVAVPAVSHLLRWSEVPPGRIGGIAIGLGPGLFTGMRVGIATGKTLAQVLRVPIVGMASLDVLAFDVRYSRRPIVAVIDARRKEVFYAFYRPVPGGVARETGFQVGSPEELAAEIGSRREEMLLVGNGALLYRRTLEEELGSQVELASMAHAYPEAAALVELAVPRFVREEAGRPEDLQPYYVRKSDAEIAWDKRARTA